MSCAHERLPRRILSLAILTGVLAASATSGCSAPPEDPDDDDATIGADDDSLGDDDAADDDDASDDDSGDDDATAPDSQISLDITWQDRDLHLEAATGNWNVDHMLPDEGDACTETWYAGSVGSNAGDLVWHSFLHFASPITPGSEGDLSMTQEGWELQDSSMSFKFVDPDTGQVHGYRYGYVRVESLEGVSMGVRLAEGEVCTLPEVVNDGVDSDYDVATDCVADELGVTFTDKYWSIEASVAEYTECGIVADEGDPTDTGWCAYFDFEHPVNVDCP